MKHPGRTPAEKALELSIHSDEGLGGELAIRLGTIPLKDTQRAFGTFYEFFDPGDSAW